MADAPLFDGLHPHITLPRLQPLGENAWTARSPLEIYKVNLGARMTVVRLADGTLWIHSPVPLTKDLQLEVDALGEVAHIVAPSLFHHLFAPKWAAAYPDAAVWTAPGLIATKRPDLADRATELGAEAPTAWHGQIEQVVYDAAPMMNEVVFYHRASGALLLCDLCFNVQVAPWRLTRWFVRIYGAWKRFGPSLSIRLLTKDKARAREVVETMCSWPFTVVSVAHGELLKEDAHARFTASWDWLPEPARSAQRA